MKKLFSLFLISFYSLSLFSQVVDRGNPISWNLDIDNQNVINYSLPSFDLERVQEEDEINDNTFNGPWRFGYMHNVDYGFDNGTWTKLDNGDRIWRILISSKGALSLNFIFDEFYMPEGAYIHLYNDEKTDILGAYDSTQNQDSGILGTWLVQGDKVWIEYYEPLSTFGQGRLHIAKATHGYRNAESYKQAKALNSSGDCNLDVDCSIGDDWEELKEHNKRSAGILLSGGSGFCSGALINNTANDGTPYFLTANHCYSNPANWAFRFGWISPDPVCATTANSTNGPTNMTLSGATLRSRDAGSDFALVEINQPIPEEWDRVFAGWDKSEITPEFTVGIHHPAGDIMKVCRDNDQPIQANNAGAQTWEITTAGGGWEIGVTEPGSSGSPLFDNEGRIIGQLYGGGAACSGTVDNGLLDYYGRLGVSWEGGGSSSTRLRDWLDPNGSNPDQIDPYPSLVTYPYDIGVVSIDSPTSGTLSDSETVTISIENFGENPVTSFEVSFQVNSGEIITEFISNVDVQPGDIYQYTFTQTASMPVIGNTYAIVAITNLENDGDVENDALFADVTFLQPNDIGVSEIISPVSGELLTNSEPIILVISNYGGETQTNFEVNFVIDGELITEIIAGPLVGNTSIEYTFNQTVDLSGFGSYSVVAYTNLEGDSDSMNDSTIGIISNINCSPVANCSGYDDGFQFFQIADIVNPSGCEGGYSNFTDLSTDLAIGETYDVTVTTGYGDQHVRIWIDFNDDFNFTLDEIIVSDYVIAPGQALGSYTETFPLTVPETSVTGTHLMRIKANWAAAVPDDACADTVYGETEDYTVNIVGGAQYDVGVIDILSPTSGLMSSNEQVSIEIYNYGESDITNFEVGYQLDNGEIIIEVFTETIASAQSAIYSFNSLLDLSNTQGEVISIYAFTALDNDEDPSNDTYVIDLVSLYPADVGVSAMISPQSGVLLSDSESIIISITNFGGEVQSNFEATYLILETGETVTEVVPGAIEPNSSIEFTFSQTADLSIPGIYTFECFTSLVNDSDPSNDSASVEIINSNCVPNINCSFNDGFQLFQLGDIINESGCEEGGFSDFTDLSTILGLDTSYELTVTTGYGDQHISVWIDFNDDFTYSNDELVINNYVIAPGQGPGSYTETIPFNLPADSPVGVHTLRAKSNWNAPVPDDSCEETTYGETEDYTVEIVESLGIANLNIDGLIIYPNPIDNQLNIVQNSNKILDVFIFDITGKLILQSKANYTSNTINVSSLESGIYFLQICSDGCESSNFYKVVKK